MRTDKADLGENLLMKVDRKRDRFLEAVIYSPSNSLSPPAKYGGAYGPPLVILGWLFALVYFGLSDAPFPPCIRA